MIKEFMRLKAWDHFLGRTFSFWPPMVWTYATLVIAILATLCVAAAYYYLAFTLFLLSGLFDEIDGKVARYSNTATYLGGFTDGVLDRFVDFLLILSYFFLKIPDFGLNLNLVLFFLLFATLMPPFIVAYANHRQAVPDPTEKVIWRLAFRVEYVVLLLAGILFYPVNPEISSLMLYLSLILNWATVIQSFVLVLIKAQNYPQKNEKASEDFHKILNE
ncbi:CDP-alcohol phosphatidyltransferase family protein [bacterium]|nr:CDP-alcohol phosphatidyltransferase family protein [bacterium]